MKTKHYDVVIAGGGLAGIAAAKVFSKLGIHFLVVEENHHLGGQMIRRQRDGSILDRHPDKIKKTGFQLADEFSSHPDILRASRILGIFEDRKIYLEDAHGNPSLIDSDYILLATGARETHLPFKGWTLPGVVSLGGCQVLMKSSGILPGENTVIAGGGPLLYVLSGQILRHGGHVPLFLDRSSLIEKMKFMTVFPPQWSKASQAIHDMGTLLSHHTPVLNQHAVKEARGDGRVEEIVYAKLNSQGGFIPGSEQTVTADSLAIGQGFVANTELAAGAGCELHYDETLRSWLVQTDDGLKTSNDHIYAAGEITGIGGGEKSLREGELAALSIAVKMGKAPAQMTERIKQLQTFRHRQISFNAFLADLCHVPAAAWDDIPDDTILCRCEDITMGDLKKAMDLGLDSVNLIKRGTRMGMGRCQGRTCVPILNEILKTHHLPSASASIRFPVKPVSLSCLETFSDE